MLGSIRLRRSNETGRKQTVIVITTKFERIDKRFANEVLNIWFSHLMKELCNFILKYIDCPPSDCMFITVVAYTKS